MTERFDLAAAILECARQAGIEVDAAGVSALARHARRVLDDERLHLTSIRDPAEFVARHVAESLEGAALLDPAAEGWLLDLGSGNGYPGLAVSIVRRGLTPLLLEANGRKARFLADCLADLGGAGRVWDRHVQRVQDLDGSGVGIGECRVLVTRATGGWEKIVPRLVPLLAPGGEVLLWVGADAGTVLARKIWQRLRLVERRALAGRERSWIWRFAVAEAGEDECNK